MTPDSNYVYEKGTILAAPGGGGALTPLPVGASGQVLGADPTAPLGVAWGAGSSSGNVVGPVSSTAHHLAAFADTSGVLLEDSGILSTEVAKGPGTSVANHVVGFTNTDGQTLEDTGLLYTNIATGPASATAGNFPSFNGTGGKILQDSGYSNGSFSPAPVVGGAAATKGTFTLTGGSSGDISTTAIATGSVVCVTVTTLGTVSVAQSFLVTITNGSHFVLNSSDPTDTSSGNWAIVA